MNKQPQKNNNHPIPPAGVHTAAWIPYGYKYTPDTIAMLEIDPDVSEAVQYLFSEYISGRTVKDILGDLEEMGYPTPARRKIQLGMTFDGKGEETIDVWNAASFNQFFFNPIYAGDFLKRGSMWNCVYYYAEQPYPDGIEESEIEPNHHEALITREEMKSACEEFLRQRNERNEAKATNSESSGRKPRPDLPDVPIPEDTSFAALLHCGECGKQMLENKVQMGPAFSFTAYTCSSFTLSATSKCTSRFYREEEIIPVLTALLQSERSQAVKALDQIGTTEERGNQYQKIETHLQKQIDSAVEGVRKNMLTLSKQRAKNKAGKLSDEDLQKDIDRMDKDNRTFEKRVMKALIQLRSFRSSCSEENPWVKAFSAIPEGWSPLSDTVMLHSLVQRIDLYPDQPPVITLLYQDDKEELLNVLSTPLKQKK